MEKKKNRIPWIILACVMGLMLIIGACISASMLIGGMKYLGSGSPMKDQDQGHAERSYADELIVVNPGMTYSLEDLEELYGVQLQKSNDGKFFSGIYKVGKTHEMLPGTYIIDGDQEDMSHFCIFTPSKGSNGSTGYRIKAMIEYFGDYFAEFSEGELVIFTPDNNNFKMEMAQNDPLKVTDPLDSGCYRVGIDIPAGTYDLTIETICQNELEYANSEAAAYVMDNLRFDEDSITQSVPVKAGVNTTVTVKDGEYLELFGVRASMS